MQPLHLHAHTDLEKHSPAAMVGSSFPRLRHGSEYTLWAKYLNELAGWHSGALLGIIIKEVVYCGD